jgi:hypothetical protein
LKIKFDPEIFKHENLCSICLLEYNQENEITVLPCDARHYFHSECITQWLDRHGDCPICKKVITAEDFNKNKSSTNALEFLRGENRISNERNQQNANAELKPSGQLEINMDEVEDGDDVFKTIPIDKKF